MDAANIAAQIMEHLCTCPEHGYSQPGRYGTSGACAVKTDGGVVYVTKGDRNCSSAACESWELALLTCCGNDYGINRRNSTWTMKDMFLNSGLFEWHGINDFCAQRGDVYLDIDCHTAMCLDGSPDHDILGEFCIDENGGIDGDPGDQTGRESTIRPYYYANWDGILHYNGGADGGAGVEKPQDVPVIRYRVKDDGGWLPWMENGHDTGGSSDDYAGREGHGIIDVEFDRESLGPDGWFDKNMSDGKLIGITVYYDTPNPSNSGYFKAKYQVHWMGDSPSWGKWEYDDEDGGAGNDRDQVDMIRLTVEKA